MSHVILMNPNSNADTTAIMCAMAARVLPVVPTGWTAPVGPPLIGTADALQTAAAQIATASIRPWPQAIIVSAFGDPGAEALALRAPCPVIGIGAAAARAAAAGEQPFAVATTTSSLAPLIDGLMQRAAGSARYLGCFCSAGDPAVLMSDARALDRALLEQIEKAHAAGAAAVIIGGGPLGEAAERLRAKAPLRLINPILCAAQEVAGHLGISHA